MTNKIRFLNNTKIVFHTKNIFVKIDKNFDNIQEIKTQNRTLKSLRNWYCKFVKKFWLFGKLTKRLVKTFPDSKMLSHFSISNS